MRVIRPEHLISKLDYIFKRSALRSDYRKVNPLKIGICVSGGPDSMALAYLLKHATHPQVPNVPAFDIQCFIVDHGARVGSQDEAYQVHESLSKFGLRSQVLQIKWPNGVKPTEMANFESEARRERYRLITLNCITENIRHIFLGHHQDDQIETLLIRLVQKGTGSLLGLQGMAEVSAVPCCEDIFESQPTKELLLRIRSSHSSQRMNESIHEGGEILIHRPLLSYTKDQLWATCDEFEIPFVTDNTNFDPTLTVRNAVRHLRKQHRLPAAFQTDRMQTLRQEALNQRKNIAVQGMVALKRIKVLRTELRSGVIEFELPDIVSIPGSQELVAFAYALARIAELVTPKLREDYPTLMSEKVTRELLQLGEAKYNRPLQFANVTFTKLMSKTPKTEKSRMWRLSRQPMRNAERISNTQSFEDNIGATFGSLHPSRWLLWDGRYWIQILHKVPERISKVYIRSYEEADVPKLKAQLLRQGKLRSFERTLNRIAPGKIRYTLPVLTQHGEIIAFPTLDLKVNENVDVMWRIRHPIPTNHSLHLGEIMYDIDS